MNREEIKAILYDRYIRPTENHRGLCIGVEIEAPIVNLSGESTDYHVAQAAAEKAFRHFGFSREKFDDNGVCFAAVREDNGDILSFDCAYNNMEFSFGKADNLHVIDDRFTAYVRFINMELKKYGHILTGMGVNPHYDINRKDFIPTGRYRMLEHYLLKSREWKEPMFFHKYSSFGAFASASQVQLDVDKEDLLPTIQAFSLVEPVKSVLFNNALLKEEPDMTCVRDMFWENSTHGINPHNIGMFDCELTNIDDLLEYICTTSIFCTERDGKYIHFRPIPIISYLKEKEIIGEYYEHGSNHQISFKPDISDLSYLRTYKFTDLTFRGTIEFRSCCTQPFDSAMSVAAFHLGLINKTKEMLDILKNDKVLYHHGYSAAELRKMMNQRKWPDFLDRNRMRELCIKILELAKTGLTERGYGEEIYLEVLFERADSLMSPAMLMLEKMEAGVPEQEIIREYSL